MYELSVQHSYNALQIKSHWEFEIERFFNGMEVLRNGDVFCPMCEIFHQNDTMCQMGGF